LTWLGNPRSVDLNKYDAILKNAIDLAFLPERGSLTRLIEDLIISRLYFRRLCTLIHTTLHHYTSHPFSVMAPIIR